jgi:hypothetical protein
VASPQRLDFAELADGVRRNNVGIAGITFSARATVAPAAPGGDGGGSVTLDPTGQIFPLRGTAPASHSGTATWSTWRVRDWEDPSKTALEAELESTRSPGARTD